MAGFLFWNLSLMQFVIIFMAGVGTTLVAKEIKKTKIDEDDPMKIEKFVDDWYEETKQRVESSEEDSNSHLDGTPDEHSNDDSSGEKSSNEKLHYIKKHNEVTTDSGDKRRHREIGEVVKSMGVKATEHQDSVADLEQTLTQDDANVETIQSHLRSVMDTARVCEFYIRQYNGDAPLGPVEENDVPPKGNSGSNTVAFFNELFEDIQKDNKLIDDLEAQNKQLSRNKKTLREENETLKSNLNKKKEDYDELESNVEDFLSEIEQYILSTPEYKNVNKLDRKLDRLPSVIEQGNVKNRQVEDLLEFLRSETSASNYDMTSDVMEILEDIDDRNVDKGKMEDLVSKIIEKEKLVSAIENVDEESVKNRAATVESMANETSGVAADEMAKELSEGKIHKILHRQPDPDLMYAIDVTLDHFESILNTIDKEMDLDTSVEGLQDSIQAKRDNLLYYFDNRPEYNHYITKEIAANLQDETGDALELANIGKTDEASGRLYLIQVLYEVLEELYMDQQAQSVMELANQ